MKNILTFLPLGFYFTALPGYDMIEVANFEMTQEHAGMKFLILSLGTGGGHNTAANAVKQALIERGDEAQVFDCLAIVSPFRSRLVCGTYLGIVRYTPKLFGVIYSVSLTPCIGAFLGSALTLAGASGTAVKGVLLLVTYSIGLGVPFLISALLIEKLNTAFTFIKKHYRVINIVCGSFLILVGILMACGLMDRLMSIFS